MSQLQIVTVGPLIAASATKLGASQKAAAAQALVLNGAACDATANNICQSQTPSGSGALTMNGTIVVSGVALIYANYTSINRRVYITSAGNDSGRTFTVTGTVWTGKGFWGATETVTGANASMVSTTTAFATVTSVTISGAAAAGVTVGVNGYATLDSPRRILFTPSGDDSAISYVITGTTWNGTAVSETLAGVASPSTAYSVLDYATVTSITTTGAVGTALTIGTNTISSSAWVNFDSLAAMSQVAIQGTPSGTANFTFQQTVQNPNTITSNNNPLTYAWSPSTIAWANHPTAALVGATSTVQGNYAYAPMMARVLLNSGSGSVVASFLQAFTGR